MLSTGLASGAEDGLDKQVFVVPNFHPASCGWLTDFSRERNYCANSYLDHLDRVAADDAYALVISEVNTMIAMRTFRPERFEELKLRIASGRVEAVNAFFLESTICLSGGEALVKQGVEGLRWQEAMLGVRPRHAWVIDVTGMHEQMPQIAAGLGLDTLVHCRMNNFGSTMYWGQSPDGTRILTISPGHYNEWPELFRTEQAFDEAGLQKLIENARSRERRTSLADVATMRTPDGAPTLILSGSGDYSLAPLCAEYPKRFIEQWLAAAPDTPLRFCTLGDYVNAVWPGVQSGEIALPTVTGGWNFTYLGFWIQNPTVKQRFRHSEHLLAASEMLATIAARDNAEAYPSQDLNHAWLLMLLNMDRNTLWGAAGGMVFEHPESWDVKDRFDWVDAACTKVGQASIAEIAGKGTALTAFNAANWPRTDPIVLALGEGVGLDGVACQVLPDGGTVCAMALPPVGLTSVETRPGAAARSEAIDVPSAIETAFYTVQIDAATGDLVSLKLKGSDRELLAGAANVLVAEAPTSGAGSGYFDGNHMDNRPKRQRLGTFGDVACTVTAFKGPLATVIESRAPFHGGKEARRVVTFYHNHPRIDFDAYLEDIPDRTVVVAEFPLAPRIAEARRGIPYGFAHGAWPEPTAERNGYMKGITPAVRWSHYSLEGGGGVALLDRGLSGREIDGNTPLVFLINAVDKYMGYPCAWLSGKGMHHLQYALVVHGGPWEEARIPQMAWEYNAPPVVCMGAAKASDESLIQTSENIIVQAMRREGDDIEIRLFECLGRGGNATITVDVPHECAALTDLVGNRRVALEGSPTYRFDIRPQQIVTLRLKTDGRVPDVEPLTDWAPLAPEHKRPALSKYEAGLKGHPPAGY